MAVEYRITVSDKVRTDMRRILSEAEFYGFSEEVEAAMSSLYERMRTDPRRFGEPAYSLPSGKGVVYRDMRFAICIYFAVYETERMVWVSAIRRVSFIGE